MKLRNLSLSCLFASVAFALPGAKFDTLALSSRNASGPSTLSPQQTITSAGLVRTFYYYKPLNYNSAKGLLMYLHGGGGNATTSAYGGTDRLWLRLADRTGVLVIFPNGQPFSADQTSFSWNDCMADSRPTTGCTDCPVTGDDVQFLRDLILWATNNIAPPIDTNRVYVIGESKGGQMSERMALEANDVIAAVGNVAGNLPVSNDNSPDGSYKCRGYTAPYTPGTNEAVPIFLFKGDNDPRIPFGDLIGADHTQYCLEREDNVNPPCSKGALHSYYDTLAFWEWKHNLSPAPTVKAPAVASTTFADSVPSCTFSLDYCDASYVIRRDTGSVPSRVVQNRAVGGGHAFPGPDVETQRQFNAVGWKNRDVLANGYIADDAWAFFTQFTLAS